MIQKYDEFFNEEYQLTDSELEIVNEASVKIANKIKSGEEIDEGILGGIIGGLTGAAIGPAIGRAICRALGISGGLLYDLLNSRVFTAAVASYIGYKN